MLSEQKLKIYGVWVNDSKLPHGGGWAKDGNGRIYEHFSQGAAISLAREWNWPNATAAEIGDDGFPVVKGANETRQDGGIRWQSEQPTEEGFYWLRNSTHSRKPVVVELEKSTSGEMVIPELYDETRLDEIKGGEWYGPLSVPD